jgi:hypothetical protein
MLLVRPSGRYSVALLPLIEERAEFGRNLYELRRCVIMRSL